MPSSADSLKAHEAAHARVLALDLSTIPSPLVHGFSDLKKLITAAARLQCGQFQLHQIIYVIMRNLVELLQLSGYTPTQLAEIGKLDSIIGTILLRVTQHLEIPFFGLILQSEAYTSFLKGSLVSMMLECPSIINPPSTMNTLFDVAFSQDQLALDKRLTILEGDEALLLSVLGIPGPDAVSIMIAAQSALDRSGLTPIERSFILRVRNALQKFCGGLPPSIPSWVVTKWQVQRLSEIGRGGFGVVHKAIWKSKMVALKEFGSVDAKSSVELIVAEISLWKDFDHPHVLPFLGAAPFDAVPFILMPFAANGDAKAYLLANPAANRGRITHQVALGLEYLHSHSPPILHADLKAMNVLIGDNGQAMLADFGLARLKKSVTSSYRSYNVMGSLQWLAPERMNLETLTQATDMYAFAVTMFEVYTGHVPFEDCASEYQYKRLIVDEERRAPQTDSTVTPPYYILPGIWTVMNRCWSQNATDRPTSSQVVALTSCWEDKFPSSPFDAGEDTRAVSSSSEAETDLLADVGRGLWWAASSLVSGVVTVAQSQAVRDGAAQVAKSVHKTARSAGKAAAATAPGKAVVTAASTTPGRAVVGAAKTPLGQELLWKAAVGTAFEAAKYARG